MSNNKPVVDYDRKTVPFYEEVDWPEGTFDEVIQQMNEYKKKYQNVIDAKIVSEWYGYEECAFNIKGFVNETDKQMQERISKEKRKLSAWEADREKENKRRKDAEAKKLDEERKEFERLKAKFEAE